MKKPNSASAFSMARVFSNEIDLGQGHDTVHAIRLG